MQLSIPPERVAPLFKGGLLPADTRARVYAPDGMLIVDYDQMLVRGQLSRPARTRPSRGPAAQDQEPWTRFLAWLMRGSCRSIARSARPTARPIRRCAWR